MENEELNEGLTKQHGIVIVILVIFFSGFYYFYNKQEQGITVKLNECSVITVIKPIRMPDSITLYFTFKLDDELIKSSTSVGAGDVGYSYTKSLILSSRYFVRVNCKDFQINRVLWDIPVPDSLTYIPKNGWKEIPYGLDKLVKE